MVPESLPRPAPSRLGRPVYLVLLLALALAPSAAHGGGGERYALLVGFDRYQHWSPLVNPLPDVRALEAELRHRYGFLPEVLENPTREALVAKLRRYYQIPFGPEDQLVIVFAGHGTYDEVSRIGYLVAADSKSRQHDPNFVTLLNYPWLLSLIDHIDCPNILLVVDACYSGSLGSGPSVRGAASGPPRVRRFLTSGGIEYVPDGDPDQHTPFMRRLLAGLRSPGNDGLLPLDELLERHMSRVEPRPKWGGFGADTGAPLVFDVRGSAPPPLSASSATTARAVLETPPPPPPAPPAAVAPRLRSEPKRLGERDVERAIARLELYDVTRNVEGDFPNQYRLQENDGWEVVVDLESGLTWQPAGSEYRMSLAEAEAYVAQLNRQRHAGYGDWRLPTFEELASLIEPQRQAAGLFIHPWFDTDQETCWSADQSSASQHHYYVSFNTGRTILSFDATRAFARAVRSN